MASKGQKMRLAMFIFAVPLASLPALAEQADVGVKITDLIQEGYEIAAAHQFGDARIVYLQKGTEVFQCVIEENLEQIKEWFKADVSICSPFSSVKRVFP
jgi:hypothetical protein